MLGLIGVLGAACAGCAIEDVVTAQQRLLMPEELVSQQATDGCTRFALKVVNGTATVEPLYNSTGCKSDSLRLETDTAAVYDAATATLRMPLVIRNLGGSAVVAPARVRFLADRAQFLDSLGNVIPGTPNIVAMNYDSASANGRIGLWRYDTLLAPAGQVQVLPPNGVSRRYWLAFSGSDLKQRVRIKLPAMAQLASPGLVPATAPDGVPRTILQTLRADSNITHDDAPEMAGRFPKNVVLLMFTPSANQSQRASAIDAVNGEVLGGIKVGTEGFYYVRLRGSTTTQQLFSAIQTLRSNPNVRLALVDLLDPNPAMAARSSAVPALAPDTVPAGLSENRNIANDLAGGLPYVRHHLVVFFRERATQALRQAAIAAVGGVVVGGLRNATGDGYYLVRVTADSSAATVDAAVTLLSAMSEVRLASRYHVSTIRPTLSGGLPAVPPDTVPAWVYDSANFVVDTVFSAVPIQRNVLAVCFLPGASTSARQALIDSLGGVVVGGDRMSASDGDYYVQFPSVRSISQLVAIRNRLRTSDWTDEANLILRNYTRPSFSRPREGRGWTSRQIDTIELPTMATTPSDVVPAVPPDTVPINLYSRTNIVDDTTVTGGPILKDVITVEFLPSATVASRQALIDSIRGLVVGGGRASPTTGFYYVRVMPQPTLQQLHAIVARLRGSPLIGESAVVPAVDVPDDYRPPTDGAGWTGWQPSLSHVGTRRRWAVTPTRARAPSAMCSAPRPPAPCTAAFPSRRPPPAPLPERPAWGPSPPASRAR